MSLYCLFALPFVSSLIALCALYVASRVVLRRSQANLREQIDQRLDAIVESFKVQIPMVGMFLSGPKEEELKNYARLELVKMVPDSTSVKYKAAGIALLVGFVLGTVESLAIYICC